MTTPLPTSPTTLICSARALRDFGDGFIVLLLPVYLSILGFDAFQIGLVATLALLGSALTTLAIGMIGTTYSTRTLLIASSALMTLTGLAFIASTITPLIFVIAFIGTINPSSGSVSIFVPLEHSALSHSVTDANRTRSFARYSVVGALAAALGSLAAASPEYIALTGITPQTSLQLMFAFYAALGLTAGAIYARMPRQAGQTQVPPKPLGPSRSIVIKLAALFSIDAFAGGFVVQSLMALWLFDKFELSLTTAGMFFFVSSLLAAVSMPIASWLATRIGLVNTMVWTHIPSSVCLIAAAIAPTLELALTLLLIRAALSQMDVPTRSSYVMAVVTPEERTAAASVTSVPRSLAAAASPAIAGALFATGYTALPFIICGVLKIAYDIALLWTFRHVKPPEERRA